ncbi:MAG: 23S rRNA (uracil(1939)-C(5))-methyltransferase RlmD [Betaproteobacteria bacterium]|nr:23S rRNA (uracil(1939)-C(5))-methyltransferase RlmD [Betaproteobacteria bacterium]
MTLHIDSLDAEGRGVARSAEGKVVFVEGGLPGEDVLFESGRKKARHELARAVSILEPSASRVPPRCRHFGVCGGCALQHADMRTQMAAKQRWLEENLARIGKVRAEALLPILYGPDWHYRTRARLSVRRVPKKGGVLVGFREKRSTYVADMRMCPVLPDKVSRLIVELKALIECLSINDRIPQVEVACGEDSTILVFRHLLPLTDGDLEKLRSFGRAFQVHVWLQPKGPESAHGEGELHYELPEFRVRIAFRPTEFTQVNSAVNRALVSRAVRLLDPRPGERVADLFCGLGNFSLPLARSGAQVVGFEGSASLIERARQNALANGLVAQFEVRDLFKHDINAFGPFDKLLVDPPREGAVDLVKSLPDPWPARIVYVSCDPATLARDAGILVHAKGFALRAAGVVNMFPHTAHVESIALFERG